MSIVKIRYTDGTWRNICSCKLMKPGGVWTAPLKHGDKIQYNGSWVTIDCLVVIACGGSSNFSGGQSFPTEEIITLGTGLGQVTLTYEAYGIPDKFEVWFNGVKVIDTGYKGQTGYQSQLNSALASRGLPSEPISGPISGTFAFTKTTTHSTAIVKVYAPLNGTAWLYSLSCPV